MGTCLITGVKLWKHKGKEWRPPLPYHLVEAIEKGAFGSPSTSVAGKNPPKTQKNNKQINAIGLVLPAYITRSILLTYITPLLHK